MANTGTKRRRRREPVPEPSTPAATKTVLDRRGLWVVVSGRMKQYGDVRIERPGQVIRQQYLRNDDVLLKHNYVSPLQDHEDAERCEVCGLVFTGSVTAGSYKAHREYARHDLAKVDLDAGTVTEGSEKARVGDIVEDPDSEAGGEWDIEPDGAPGEKKLEEINPGGVRVSMGR